QLADGPHARPGRQQPRDSEGHGAGRRDGGDHGTNLHGNDHRAQSHAPYHDEPYQDEPYQEEPSGWPYHDEPYRDEPYHDEPYQDAPVHEAVVNRIGFQTRSWAVSVPERTVPQRLLRRTRTVPRLRSRLPNPLERSRPWLARPAGAAKLAA